MLSGWRVTERGVEGLGGGRARCLGNVLTVDEEGVSERGSRPH